ncbi:hypothetical protein CP533_5031 [Ophiocordyceps camponoti-saundersi (nom. inval.)]|nr:hypothetical protein CP533_5031 [Ophiocordyceps camponoti-saundersi (nom. inval.)]
MESHDISMDIDGPEHSVAPNIPKISSTADEVMKDVIVIGDEPRPGSEAQDSGISLSEVPAQDTEMHDDDAGQNTSVIDKQSVSDDTNAKGKTKVKEEYQTDNCHQGWTHTFRRLLSQWMTIVQLKSAAVPPGALELDDLAFEPNCEPQRPTRGCRKIIYIETDEESTFDDDDSNDDDSNDDDLNDGDFVPGSIEKEKLPKGQRQPKKKKQRKGFRAKNAREFIAHLQEMDQREWEAGGKKRSAEVGGDFARKRQMTSHGGQVSISTLVEERTEQDGNPTSAEPAPLFAASVIQDQLSKMSRNIPAGADTRRTRTQAADLKEAYKLFGFRQIKARDGKWLLLGMKSHLESYQLTAAAWMIKRELGRDYCGPFGGLFADYMGMGKTITSLACVLGNPPFEADVKQFSSTTLVLVPNAGVANSWIQEIQKHYLDKFAHKVKRYDNQDHTPLGLQKEIMLCIATYKELLQSYPSDKFINELAKEYQHDHESYEKELKDNLGFLLRQKWYRVILDEAHEIKNVSSRTKKACCLLQSKHNWALTGTPLANSALVHRLPHDGLSQNFQEDDKANEKFESLVSMIMYRRTPEDQFMGHKILQLPESHQKDIWLPLPETDYAINQEITSFYNRAITAAKARLENCGGESAEKTLERIILTKNMILREASSHFFNLEKWLRKSARVNTIQELKRALCAIDFAPTILDYATKNEVDGNHLAGYEKGVARMREHKEAVFGGKFEWELILDTVELEVSLRDAECGGCKDPVQEKKTLRLQPPMTCGVEDCGKVVDGTTAVKTLDSIYHEATADELFEEPGKDSNGVFIPRKVENGCFFVASARYPEFPLVPSAKLTAAMAVIFTWLEECPEDKIIVFAEFINSIKVLGCMLQKANIAFLYHTGAMTETQKNKAISDFSNDATKKILVSTMRTGGQALNLTSANRVITIDPWWNTTKEKQANCRVQRFGQTKETHLVRILVRDAEIESKISSTQVRKDEEIDYALQDDGHIPQTMDDAEFDKLFMTTASKKGRKGKKAIDKESLQGDDQAKAKKSSAPKGAKGQKRSLACPPTSNFYICSDKPKRFIGCCTTNACEGEGECPPGNVEYATFDPSRYSDIVSQDCDTSSSTTSFWWTCQKTSPPFLGCCGVDACQHSSGCPSDKLGVARLSENRARAAPFLPLGVSEAVSHTISSERVRIGTGFGTSTDTSTATPAPPINGGGGGGSISNGAAAGIGVGASILSIALIALIAFYLWRRRAARKEQNNKGPHQHQEDQQGQQQQLQTRFSPLFAHHMSVSTNSPVPSPSYLPQQVSPWSSDCTSPAPQFSSGNVQRVPAASLPVVSEMDATSSKYHHRGEEPVELEAPRTGGYQ